MTFLMVATGVGLQLTCDPCGIQLESALWAAWWLLFFASGVALCAWIEQEWPQQPWSS